MKAMQLNVNTVSVNDAILYLWCNIKATLRNVSSFRIASGAGPSNDRVLSRKEAYITSNIF